MAGFRERIEVLVELLSKDKASKDLDKVGDKAEKLDGKTAKVEVTADADDAKGDIDRIEDELRQLDGETAKVKIDSAGAEDFADAIGGIPGNLGQITGALGPGGSVAAGAGAIAVALFAAAENAANLAIEAQTTATLTGDTIEDASRLQAVWQSSDADLNDLNDVLLQMNGVLADNPELARQLGMNLNDGKTIGERFRDAVQMVGDGLIDARTQSQLFGEEGVRQVARLVTVVDGDLQGALNRVSDTRVVDQEDIDAALEFKQAMAELKATMGDLAVELGEGVLPALTDVVETLNAIKVPEALKFLTEWVGPIAWAKRLGDAYETMWDKIDGDTLSRAGHVITGLKEIDTASGDLADTLIDTQREIRGEVSALEDWTTATSNALLQAEAYDTALGSAEWGKAGFEAADTAMDEFTNNQFGLKDIVIASETAFKNLSTAVKDNGLNFDVTTEAGQQQHEALKAVAETIDTQLIAAYSDAKGDGDKFKESAAGIANTLKDRLRKELGLSEEDANAMIDQLGLMPDDIETRYKLTGTEEAKIKIGLLGESIALLPRETRLEVENQIINGDYQGAVRTIQTYNNNHPTNVRTNSAAGDTASGRNAVQNYNNNHPTTVRVNSVAGNTSNANRAMASGGVVQRGQGVTLVGEEGPELVTMPGGSTVYPADETRRMMAGGGAGAASSGGGGSVINVNLSVNVAAGANPVTAGQQILDVLVPALRTGGAGRLRRELGL